MPPTDGPRTAILDRERPVWWISFVAVALVAGVWALGSPLMSVPDEPAHTIKAVGLWQGEWSGGHRPLPSDDPNDLSTEPVAHVPEAFARLHLGPGCFKGRPAVTANCVPPVGQEGDVVEIGSPVGDYPPLFYALTGWPSRLFEPKWALYAMRLCSVLVGAALLASALSSARSLGRWRAGAEVVGDSEGVENGSGATRSGGLGVIGVTLALTPMCLFLIGSVNPNGIEIAAAITTFAAVLDLATRRGAPPGRLLVRVVVASTFFVTARPLSTALFGVVVLVVALAALDRVRLVELARDTRARLAAAGVAVVAVSSALLMAVHLPQVAGAPRPDLTFRPALSASMDALSWRSHQMIGVFGWLDTPVPTWLVDAWLLAVGVLVVAAMILDSTVRRRLALVVMTASSVLVPAVVEAVQAHSYGLYWQGRYTLPLAVGVPILAGWMLAESAWVAGRPGRRVATIASVVVALAVGGAQLYSWAMALSRYVVGEPTGAFSFLQGDGWHPPLGTTVLFVLALLAFATYTAWTMVLLTGSRTDPTSLAPDSDRSS